MANLALLNPPRGQYNQFSSYVSSNFRRVVDGFRRVPRYTYGTSVVNGSLQVDTGLDSVKTAVAHLESVSADAAYIEVELISPKIIELRVIKSDFSASIVNTTVHWVAFGD